jgi:hypothetical protein
VKEAGAQITIVDGEDILPKSNVERLAQRTLRRVRKTREKIERFATDEHERVAEGEQR